MTQLTKIIKVKDQIKHKKDIFKIKLKKNTVVKSEIKYYLKIFIHKLRALV